MSSRRRKRRDRASASECRTTFFCFISAMSSGVTSWSRMLCAMMSTPSSIAAFASLW